MNKHIVALVVLLLSIFFPIKSGIAFAQHIGTGPSNHTIAAKSDGTVYTWGWNGEGELGNGTTVDSNVPVAVSTSGTPMAGKTITQVAAGYYHSIALASNGTVYTWGANGSGQLGNGTTTDSDVPVAVSTSGTPMAGKTILQVAAGYRYSIALASDGTVYTWGANAYGQLGNGTTTNSNVPVAVSTSGTPMDGKTITQVAAGTLHSIALASDGKVYSWGDNQYGQLGNGTTTQSNVPVAVSTSGTPMAGKTIIQVAAGYRYSIALASDGTVYTWGWNAYGQLGNGTNTASNVPVAVSTSGTPMAGKTITQVAAGYYHSIALASDGTVYTWGANGSGQLGKGTTTDSDVPVAVSTSGVLSGKTITQVAAGYEHSFALASDGSVYTWGQNNNGQLGNGSTTNSNVPVAVDQSFIGPLPVELTSFSANFLTDSVELNWQTATEVNNYGFDVQRSASSGQQSDWSSLGFVAGNGNSNSPKDYSFVDEDIKNQVNGKYYYRLKQIDTDGSYSYSTEIEVDWTNGVTDVNDDDNLPKEYSLSQNYPNPFNPGTVISYQLPALSQVTLKVYDVLGREIAALVNEVKPAGEYEVEFNGKGLSSGMYFYELRAGNFVQVNKMILMK